MFEAALEAGAADVVSAETGHDVTCAPDDLSEVRDALAARFGDARSPGLDWKPNVSIASTSAGRTLLKLLAALDDSDDVQRVMANFEVSEEVWRG
jgi:transcriptional/translational regulatory protein YebC/TACO1